MDKVDRLKSEGNIISSSLDAIAYVVYCDNCEVSIICNEVGYKLFCIRDTEANRTYFDMYKEDKYLMVELKKYNRIIKKLKNLCKNYLDERWGY